MWLWNDYGILDVHFIAAGFFIRPIFKTIANYIKWKGVVGNYYLIKFIPQMHPFMISVIINGWLLA
ncbi:MAG TPA: hypothetical protein DIS90_03520 [Cytophagales bacterium]|nr:hypothetical protein [Cytophagales bacterium]